MHFVFVAFGDAKQAVQAPAVFTAAVNERRYPLVRVVIVGLFVFGSQLWVGANGIARSAHFFYQRVTAGALQHINAPRLGIGARRRSGGQLQQVRDDIAGHGCSQKIARRLAAFNGLINNIVRKNRGHFKVSSTENSVAGSAVGLRVARSTYTWMKWPLAAQGKSASAGKMPNS